MTKAKAKGIKIQLATILPFKGATLFSAPYYDAAAETKRQAVNDFTKANATIDGVVDDLSTAVQDSTDALTLKATFDSGDHLHPNDLGYQAMAAAFDLTRLR